MDRDTLMYQAGRAPCRRRRGGRRLAGPWRLGQTLTLLMFLARPGGPPAAGPRVEPTPLLGPVASPEGWTARRDLLDSGADPVPPRGEENLVPDDPPLRVFSSSWAAVSFE
ncbi:MAG: hypothetical protein U0797_18865 [Gemmataceae bacterium]